MRKTAPISPRRLISPKQVSLLLQNGLGKYCLSGKDAGVGPTCPTEMLGATHTTLDDQSCVPLTLLEVPCDIRSLANNCIWDTKSRQCGRDEEIADCRVRIDSNSPISVTGVEGQIVF